MNNLNNLSLKREFIDNYMEVNGMESYAQMARDIGISPSMLNGMFSGRKNPGGKVIRKMLDYFEGTKFEELFY